LNLLKNLLFKRYLSVLKNIVKAVKEKFTSKKKDEVQSSDLDVNASDFAELNNITQEDLKNEFQNSGISR